MLAEGHRVLEVGPGMGFFTLPMARVVGDKGKILCVDLQEKMLQGLKKRAAKAGLADRIETRLCTPESLGIGDQVESIDFILAFNVIHEVPDSKNLIAELERSLKPGSKILVAEPQKRVSPGVFAEVAALFEEKGIHQIARPDIKAEWAAIYQKNKS